MLSAFEEAGRCRRGYFVEGLGAAQFAAPGAVDRLRAQPEPARRRRAGDLVLAATDPANPYGAALPWPAGARRRRAGLARAATAPAARPARWSSSSTASWCSTSSAAARSLLSFTDDAGTLAAAAEALAHAVRDGALGSLAVERVDGASALSSPLTEALAASGFRATPRGLRLRR